MDPSTVRATNGKWVAPREKERAHMGPGFQRYSLVLLLLAGGAAMAGCSRGGSGSGGFGRFASTAAPTTSSSPAVVKSTTVVKGPGPEISTAGWSDGNNDGYASAGDKIQVIFAREIKFKATTVDASK